MRTTRLLTKGAAVVATSCFLVSAAASTALAQDAQALYKKSCLTCHGAGGKGDGPAAKVLKPPPGDFATALAGKSDADLAKLIKDGRKKGDGVAAHAAFGSKLSDEQIQGVVQHIKELAGK